MKILKISTSFSKFSDADFETKAQYIVNVGIAGNANFPSPNPVLADLQTAVTRYSNGLLAAKDLGKNNVAEKNESREELELLLGQLGLYVMNVSNGSLTMLTSSGFSLTKDPEPRYIDNPGNVTLSNGISSGTMVAQVKSVKGGTGYLHEITAELPTETTVWTSSHSTTSKFTFTNLQAGKQYWVRVAVTGSRQQIAYSPVASQFVQ